MHSYWWKRYILRWICIINQHTRVKTVCRLLQQGMQNLHTYLLKSTQLKINKKINKYMNK